MVDLAIVVQVSILVVGSAMIFGFFGWSMCRDSDKWERDEKIRELDTKFTAAMREQRQDMERQFAHQMIGLENKLSKQKSELEHQLIVQMIRLDGKFMCEFSRLNARIDAVNSRITSNYTCAQRL